MIFCVMSQELNQREQVDDIMEKNVFYVQKSDKNL